MCLFDELQVGFSKWSTNLVEFRTGNFQVTHPISVSFLRKLRLFELQYIQGIAFEVWRSAFSLIIEWLAVEEGCLLNCHGNQMYRADSYIYELADL